MSFFGAPGAIRTRGLSLRRRTLYPTELRKRMYLNFVVYHGDVFRRRGGERNTKTYVSLAVLHDGEFDVSTARKSAVRLVPTVLDKP